MIYRTGRKVGHTLYKQEGTEPSDDDMFIGSVLTPELARELVDAANFALRVRENTARLGKELGLTEESN